jgi:peptidoglycan hydrolase-like protein with peptidoglycan-binding domain
MRTALRLCLVLIWGLAALLPASGASVIFYSKADNAYGWCAGYSYGRGESCAREQCLEFASGCELAIECDGGWSATAFSADPIEGFGASCEWQTAGLARSIALLSCIYASRALCSTSAAFDGNARSASASANEAYDLAWYTQSLLLTLGYDIGEVDGEIGTRTRAAITDFQTAIGLEPTGLADWPLTDYLLYAAGGTARFVQDVIAETDAADQHIVRTYTYRYAAAPASQLSLADELGRIDKDWQRTIIAALVTYAGVPCARPASAVGATGAGAFSVSCTEGDYVLSLGGPTPVVTSADGTFDINPIPVTCPTEGAPLPGAGPGSRQFKPSTMTLNGPAPGSSANADCPPPGAENQKFSPNTINGMAPSLGATAGGISN